MIEMCEVINTVQFRFPAGSPRPSWVEIASFLKQLETDLMQMDTAYKTAHDRSLFIKFSSQDAMMESLRKNTEPRKFAYASGETIEVRMSIAGTNVRYVRVFDLPPELSDDRLSLKLEEFGKVERVVREKFPAESGIGHMYTGVRGVYIDVKKDIPPAVDVENWKGRIFYGGLKDTCFLCQAVGHRKDSCPQRGVRNKQEKKNQESAGSSSYAAVVSGQESASDIVEVQEMSVISEDEIIEVVESAGQPSDTVETDPGQSTTEETGTNSEKVLRPKSTMEKLEDASKAILELMGNPTASQRRAQFKASSSGSGSGSRSPKKKCVRKTYY